MFVAMLVAALAWLPTILALTDATFSALIQTAGVVISTSITAVVGYMGLKLNAATKRRNRPDE